MKRHLRLGTLDSRIFSIFTILIFTTVFIMQLVSFRFTINRIRNSFIESNHAMLDQLVNQVDTYITGMQNLSFVIAEDEEIKTLLDSTESAPDMTRLIESRLRDYILAREDISLILVVGQNGRLLSGEPQVKLNPWAKLDSNPWYIEAGNSYDKTVVSTSYVQNIIAGRYTWVVSLSRGIQSKENGETKGILLIDLKFNRIKDLCQSLVIGQKGYNFIIDDEGNYIYHPTQQLLYSNLRSEPVEALLELSQDDPNAMLNTDDKYYMSATSPLTGWHMISVMHDSEIITDWGYVRLTYSGIGLFLFIIVGLATNRISSGITKPVRKLQNIMKSVDTGEFKLVGSIRATDEIRELAREYDIMVGRIRELMKANIHEQELKRKSDLKALQAQINPHFLYNTLDSIIWMAEMNLNRRVVDMTSALSKLFRISISKGREFIPVSDEIAHVESYLTIQQMRYKDNFTYDIKIDQAIYQEVILKITLQPLVENAIYHGIKEAEYKGRIEITGSVENDTVVIKVIDNGRGITPERMNQLKEHLSSSINILSGSNSHGMGVKNVHERIRIYFGEEWGLTLESAPGEGTCVTVRIPAGFEGGQA